MKTSVSNILAKREEKVFETFEDGEVQARNVGCFLYV